jgi:hypothetical protein
MPPLKSFFDQANSLRYRSWLVIVVIGEKECEDKE